MSIEKFTKSPDGKTYMEVDNIGFLDIGDKLENANGKWIIEGKVVQINNEKKYFWQKEKDKKYNIKYIFRKI